MLGRSCNRSIPFVVGDRVEWCHPYYPNPGRRGTVVEIKECTFCVEWDEVPETRSRIGINSARCWYSRKLAVSQYVVPVQAGE